MTCSLTGEDALMTSGLHSSVLYFPRNLGKKSVNPVVRAEILARIVQSAHARFG